MIQSLTNLFIDPKLAQATEGIAESNANMLDPETMLENTDFANELLASLGTETTEGQAVALGINPELNPELILGNELLRNPASLEVPVMPALESATPSLVDPALTKEVHQIISPKTTQVQNPEMEVEQLLNTKLAAFEKVQLPQTAQPSRAPAIVFDNAEIDAQLMNFDDFVTQKNLSSKKNLSSQNGYGLNVKNQSEQIMNDLGLKNHQVVKEVASSDANPVLNSAVNSQEFILTSQIEQNNSNSSFEVSAPTKTFNMSNLKTENAEQIMNEITNYIVQSKAAKETTVNLRVNHEELGIIDITVNKLAHGKDGVGVNIGAHSVEGKSFFQTNAKELLSHLTNTGLNVADLKVETPSSSSKSNFDFNSQSQNHSSEKHMSEQNQKRQDSERRQELWDLLKDKEAA